MKGPLTMAQPSLGGASFAAEVVAQEPEKKPAVKKERDPYDAARTETTKLANLIRGGARTIQSVLIEIASMSASSNKTMYDGKAAH